jgi:hypothetical protein
MRPSTKTTALAALATLAALAATACDSDPTTPEGPPLFVLEVSGETFRAVVLDTMQVRLLEERMAAGTEGVVNGELLPGDGGFNQPWGWHWDPETVHVADTSIELCDGRPSLVEEDLPYWLDTVGRFCPWSARVVSRVR